MRLFATAVLYVLLAALAVTGAPVPKDPKQEPTTADMMAGTWLYSWGTWPNGVIALERDGSYSAVHDANSGTAYCGTWTFADDVLTIREWSVNRTTGERGWGPNVYVFDFKGSKYPVLAGTSRPGDKVKLWNRVK